MRLVPLIAALIFCLMLRPAAAQHNPFVGPGQYPQFRNLSGLAGGAYGLDAEGEGSLSGPTAYSTPIAYVLGHDQFRLGIGKASFNSGPNFDNNHSNGKGIITYGHTFGSFNLAATDLIKSAQWDQSYNLQIEYLPERDALLVPSVGVQDVLGLGGSAGIGVFGNRQSSRSLFGVLTWRIRTRRTPFYLSAGMGTHRFGKGFASSSYQVGRLWRLWLEYDGWGFNEGALFTLQSRIGHHRWEWNTDVGFLRGRYLLLAAVLGF